MSPILDECFGAVGIPNLGCGRVKRLSWVEGGGEDPRTLFEMKVLEMNVGFRILS